MFIRRDIRAIAAILLFLILATCTREPTGPGDATPPAQITTLYVIGYSPDSVALGWTAVGDDGYAGRAAAYELRYDNNVISQETWASAEKIPGLPLPKEANLFETFAIGGMDSAAYRYFAIRVVDDAGNWSQVSNPVYPLDGDNTPSSRVTDFRVSFVAADSAVLTWTAPLDIGQISSVAAYDIRYGEIPPTVGDWEASASLAFPGAPGTPGTPETLTVHSLVQGTSYYFAIRSIDAASNLSELSNIAMRDGEAPAPVTDFKSEGGSPGAVILTWTAPKDDAPGMKAFAYDIRYSTSETRLLNWDNAEVFGSPPQPSANGTVEQATVSNLSQDSVYYFALRSQDSAGNVSALSNVVTASPPSVQGGFWLTVLGGAGNETALALLALPSGEVLVVGTTTMPSNGGIDGYLVRLDSDGALTWEKHFGGAADDRFQDVDRTADANYIAVGYSASFGAGDNDGYLVKVNADGDLLWEKAIGTEKTETILYGGAAQDGGYVLAGNSYGYTTGSAAYIAKTDPAGSIEWTRNLQIGSAPGYEHSSARGRGLIANLNGTIAFLWESDYWPLYGGPPAMAAAVQWYSATGEQIRSQGYGGGYSAECGALCLGRGNAFALLFSVACYPSSSQRLHKIAENGSTVYAYTAPH